MLRPSRAVAGRTTAFTLIELLVVVSIIALLISILLPSLSRARKQAYQVKCASNLSALYKGIFYYTEDDGHNGYLPQFTYQVTMWKGAFWAGQIAKYVKPKRSRIGDRTGGIYRCPEDVNPFYVLITPAENSDGIAGWLMGERDKERSDAGYSRSGRGTTGKPGDLIEPLSYTGNCDLTSPILWPGGLTWSAGSRGDSPRKLDDVQRPYCFPLLNEAWKGISPNYCFRLNSLLSGPTSGNSAESSPYLRHYGGTELNTNGANWTFADGHVKWHSAASNAQLLRCVEYIEVTGKSKTFLQ